MAEKAMAALQGHVMSGKEMRIFYAKSKSDAVAKLEGTFMAREKKLRPKPQAKPQAKPEVARLLARCALPAPASPPPP